MNKDQIMRAVENASPEQLGELCKLLDITPTQVPVTGRHVGCVVEGKDFYKGYQHAVLNDAVTGEEFWTSIGHFGKVQFPDPYRVPITHRWSGGKQPVADDVLVLIQFETGTVTCGFAEVYPWESASIIGFTVLDVIGVEDERA